MMLIEVEIGAQIIGPIVCQSLEELKTRLGLGSCAEYGDKLCPSRATHGHIPPTLLTSEVVNTTGIPQQVAVLPEIGRVLCQVSREPVRSHALYLRVITMPAGAGDLFEELGEGH